MEVDTKHKSYDVERTDEQLLVEFKQSVVGKTYTKQQLDQLDITDEIFQGFIGIQGVLRYKQCQNQLERIKKHYVDIKWSQIIDFVDYVYQQSTDIKKIAILWLTKAAQQNYNPAFDALALLSDKPFIHPKQCIVCMDRWGLLVIVPCMHMCVCNSCGPQLHRCPLCRSAIDKISRIYL